MTLLHLSGCVFPPGLGAVLVRGGSLCMLPVHFAAKGRVPRSPWLDQDVHLELGAASRWPGSHCAVAAVLCQPELRCEAVQGISPFQGRETISARPGGGSKFPLSCPLPVVAAQESWCDLLLAGQANIHGQRVSRPLTQEETQWQPILKHFRQWI